MSVLPSRDVICTREKDGTLGVTSLSVSGAARAVYGTMSSPVSALGYTACSSVICFCQHSHNVIVIVTGVSPRPCRSKGESRILVCSS